MTPPVRPLSRWKRLAADQSGLAAVEFGLISTFLVIGLVNGVEIARWYLQSMQVSNAVQSATLAVWSACDVKSLPAKTKCAGLNSAIATGLASTSLGTSVRATDGYPKEGYFCVNGAGALQKVANYTEAKPSTCTAAGSATTKPGDYVIVSASYNFSPIFSGLTIGNLMPKTMSSAGSMRLQ